MRVGNRLGRGRRLCVHEVLSASPTLICLSAVLVVLLLGTIALAEEVVVKNDSVVDFGDAVIVGDFIPGEHAGARLTSPCDGTIVAV